MSYFDNFKAFSQFKGANTSEQNKFIAQATFDKYFDEAIDKVSGKIDGADAQFILQHLVYGERFNDEKLMIVTNDTDISMGSLVEWDGKYWLCTNQENRSIPTHKVYKINLCNNSIKWKTPTGDIYTAPCYIRDEGLGQQDDSRKIPVSVAKRTVSVQYNPQTFGIYQNQRFIFTKRHAFVVTEIDDITRPQTDYQHGVITLKMERTQRMDADDLQNNIAFNGDITSGNIGLDGVAFSKQSLTISKWQSDTVDVFAYVSGLPQATTFTFRVDGIPMGAYDITSVTGNSITIKAEQFFYTGFLVAISPDLTETSIPLTLKSFM
jgi:hypothetical protein